MICLFYIPIFLPYHHIDDLKIFLVLLDTKFNIISDISESLLPKNHPLTTNIDILGYNIEHTPTESSIGKSLMYISQDLCYTDPQDLQIYCSNELESIFIEITFPDKPNYEPGSIYKHLSMKQFKSNNDLMNSLLDKIKKEKKRAILTGDFDLNLIIYTKTLGLTTFWIYSSQITLYPQKTLSNRVSKITAALTDNIFINNFEHKCLSANITTSVSDHLR